MTETRTVLITGGSRGIGAATALRAAAAGYAVAVNYREREHEAREVAAAIESDGGKAITVQADVADAEAIERMFAEVRARLGAVDALVNSAGIEGNKSAVADFDFATLHRLFTVNVIGTMLCCREAVRGMRAGGVIVNVSSMAATIGGRAGASDYAASKAAVDTFTVGLAKEVAADGIRVNAVRPGMTLTDMTDRLRHDAASLADIAATIPMGRIATPEEVAEPILWLLSDAAAFVSGACLDVSGGGFMIGRSLHDSPDS